MVTRHRMASKRQAQAQVQIQNMEKTGGVRLITIDNKGMPRTRTQDGQKDIENWKGAVMGKQASSALELLE